MHGNYECFSPNHIFHICALKRCGLTKADCKDFAEVAKNPKFRCRICDEKAVSDTNLCDPEMI